MKQGRSRQIRGRLLLGANWLQPAGPNGPIPRKTAWMVYFDCALYIQTPGVQEELTRMVASPSCPQAEVASWAKSLQVQGVTSSLSRKQMESLGFSLAARYLLSKQDRLRSRLGPEWS